ncbi:hypothetical protein [Tuwongella immobilis]|uniref:Uncharacterized protein n=1 Tax=Tuwongella immobilis TaxID=692036 RepID=A0A6C2YTD7_9BACT|nr:hypothetical protein [Tuwongella immobilis]VIP04736.1 Uncharacterized protein OS=Pedosphaera parvula (strain Ellin514) GN=Cflav_PD5858 PE=4 SV=1 [Tuwongella immobilis]VTS06831.1 Uncharacterized protein OS=Pedosphaera parvula (strain Ellin514) GN=Cflav_PD5858 PE=4 SV=1 [Tuwongella immobilis]
MRSVAVFLLVVVGLLNVGCAGGTRGAGGLHVGNARGSFVSQDDKLVFVVLGDEGNGGSAGTGFDRFTGALRTDDGREIPWQVRTGDGKSGRATIDGVEYDLAQGCLFLVSTRDRKTQVRQVPRDPSGVTHWDVERAVVQWAESDPEIREFVKAARKR